MGLGYRYSSGLLKSLRLCLVRCLMYTIGMSEIFFSSVQP